jgi:hypothetical protein
MEHGLMGSETSGASSMARSQKSIYLPATMADLADAYESRTGVRLNRQVIAAMLRMFVEPLPAFTADQKQPWMEYAVALEKGEASLGDIVTREIERRVAQDEADLAVAESLRAGKIEPAMRESFEKLIAHHRDNLRYWQVLVGAYDNATDALFSIYKGAAVAVAPRFPGGGDLVVWRQVKRDGEVLNLPADEVQPGDEVLR